MKHLFEHFNPTILNMAGLRMISTSLEFTSVILMLYFNSIQKAIMVNAALAFVGPFIFILTMTLGLIGIAGEMSFIRLGLIGAGTFLIILGVLR